MNYCNLHYFRNFYRNMLTTTTNNIIIKYNYTNSEPFWSGFRRVRRFNFRKGKGYEKT